jgi:hypothetical protein
MNLQDAQRIVLKRCPNGWLAYDPKEPLSRDTTTFAFESTASLAKQLETLIGKSGWQIQPVMPKRDAKGHFLKSEPEQTQP